MNNIYDILFNRILRGYYLPGTKLKEEVLAKEFNTSRTPIREILNQLTQDGLVLKEQKKGARVIGFSADDVEEVYQIRKALEVEALKYSVPFLSIQGLKDIRSDLLKLQDSDDISAYEKVDAVLHNYFVQGSGKTRLVRILEQLYRLIHEFRCLGFKSPETREIFIRTHLALTDALILRDIDSAVKILEDHLDDSKNTAIRNLLSSHSTEIS